MTDQDGGSAGRLAALSPALTAWLLFDAPRAPHPSALLHGFAQQLDLAGLALVRANVQVRPLSPEVAATNYTWRPVHRETEMSPTARVVGSETHTFDGGVVQAMSMAHGSYASDAFKASPFHAVIVRGEPHVRRRIDEGQTDFDFPILLDLQAQGATDYVALSFRSPGTEIAGASFATSRPGGFTEADLAILRIGLDAFVHVLSPLVWAHAARTLLGVYLGQETAARVLSGRVQRGDVDEIDAAIWFSDLRGFTPLTASVDPRTLVSWLNEYFGAVAAEIVAHGGEVLKFVGDAILAVWPVTAERPREVTCREALRAALEANLALDRLNASRRERGLAKMEHGIGLHVGAVQYGNIGAVGRLDFTVIGTAVNTASRLEGACSKLGLTITASSDFAACAGGGLVHVADVELKGLGEPTAIYAPRG
jgi:adenylate cyclase